jgi:N-acetylglucosaminyl-diphospho-decaprenol L-rhamnosyltransferase
MPPELHPVRPDVTISIVSLNTRELLAACLRAVLASSGVSYDIGVVDNGSVDGSPEMIEREFPSVRLVRSEENLGFAAANNLVIRAAAGRYVLLLNPDTVVAPDTFQQLVRFMDDRTDVGICGPRITFPDGRFQSCGYPFPTLLGEVRQSRNLPTVLRRMLGPEPRPRAHAAPFEVDWVDGACLLIRREVIAKIGPLDEQYFLYAEELDWCFQARRAGWLVYALPHVSMIHHQGQSSAQMSEFSLAHLIETRLRYYRKNHGVVVAIATSLVYIAGALKQFRRNRRKETVKIRATARWWRSLLTT